MKCTILGLTGLLVATVAFADVAVLERHGLSAQNGPTKAKRAGRNQIRTGEQTLIDASNLEYFINTDITFTTSSSASGAASEASYTGPVSATTSGGGTVSSTLNDAFDGYNSLCVSTTGATGPCTTGDANYTVYNNNGTGTLDASCANRQIILNAQTIGTLSVQRKIFVPTNDEFARWQSCVTNNGASTATVNLITANNLGSDGGTTIVSSSNGNATAELTDTWVSTFQNYSGTTSPDVRLGHVLQGAGAASPLVTNNFVDGDDNPFWAYTLNVPAGATKCVLNFVTGQPSKAEANAKAAELAGLPANATQCLSLTELGQVCNFAAQGPPPPSVTEVPTASGVGLAALALLLGGASFFVLRRRSA